VKLWRGQSWKRRVAVVAGGTTLSLVALCVVGYALNSDFLGETNISIMLRLASAIGVVSVGMTFVIISGGIDLSVGSMVALASVWMTTVATQEYGPFVMVLCAMLVGLGAGLINGVLIAYGKIVPFIATLAMYASARGLAERLSNKETQTVKDQAFRDFFRGDILGIPVLIWMLAIVFAVGWVLLNRTTFGRRTFAIGGNTEAARLAGINVKRHTVLLYVLLGICCGIAALILVARTSTGSSTHGQLYELEAIAAAVIGGALLSGGRGSIVGTVFGVLIFATLTNVFVLNNRSQSEQQLLKGAIIVAAVLIQQRLASRNSST